MEPHFLLAVIIVLPFSCFRVTCSYELTFLESAVDIEVTGNCTVRSGVSQYIAYGNSSKLERFNCMVRNDTGKLKEVTIRKNGEKIQDVRVSGDVWYIEFDDINVENDKGIYSCRAMFEIKNRSFSAQYYVEKEVEVVTVQQSYVIASDVGSRVYAGERISISCNGFYETEFYVDEDDYSFFSNYGEIISPLKERCPVVLIGDPCPTIEVPFDRVPRNVTCDLRPFTKVFEESYEEIYNQSISTCSKSIYLELDISPELSVSLEPQRFDILDNELNFVCTSDPPRLMYWTVQTTENSNMMDIQNPSAVSTNTKIYITQKPGKTSMKIEIDGEDDKGHGNGIQTVICSTYDTKEHVIKTAHGVTLDDQGSTSAATATVVSLSISLVALLSVVIVVLVLVVIFMFVRMRQIKVLLAQSPTGCSDDDKAASQSTVHGNPTYLPYAGTDQSPP